MKKTLFRVFVALLFLPVPCVIAQDNMTNKIEIGLSLTPLGRQNVGPLKGVDGAGSHESRKFFGVDATLVYPFNENLSLETGVGFSRQSVTHTGAVVDPTTPQQKHNSTLKIWELPVLAKYRFSRYIYANGGMLFHMDGSGKNSMVDKQNGVGFQLGLGASLAVSQRAAIHINPLAKLYSAIPFRNSQYPDRVLFGGVKVGIFYRIGNTA